MGRCGLFLPGRLGSPLQAPPRATPPPPLPRGRGSAPRLGTSRSLNRSNSWDPWSCRPRPTICFLWFPGTGVAPAPRKAPSHGLPRSAPSVLLLRPAPLPLVPLGSIASRPPALTSPHSEASSPRPRFSGRCQMKRHPQSWLSSRPLPPIPPRPGLGRAGEAPKQRAWNWQLEPELWAKSLRQQLNVQLLSALEEKRAGLSLEAVSSDSLESWHSVCSLDSSRPGPWPFQTKQRKVLTAAPDLERPRALQLLLAELQTLFSAVLQDRSPAAWRYLHAVLGLLPPYRELLVGHLDLLPFLEQLYCWAPWVQTHLQLDLLDAIDHALPPDSSLSHSASHADCHPQKKRFHRGPPCPPCPFVQTRWGGQQVKQELATWLRPLTLPELQHCLGIVGAEVALEEAQWLGSLSLLPLALATDIPVQYKSSDANSVDEEPVGSKDAKPQLDYEVSGEKPFQKRSSSFSSETFFSGSEVLSILDMERYRNKIHFLYLNVAPSRYFRPYNLVVVPAKSVNPEHYIFSPFGILHVHPVEGNEALTLGAWHHQCILWQQLQLIPFFKYCLVRKAFACWRKSVRWQGLCRLRTFLGNHLLSAVPHFGAGLLHINRLLQELHSVSWLPQEPDRCYELLDLKKALFKERRKALQLLRRCLNLCTSILQLIHEDTYHMQQGLQERVQNSHRIRTGQGSIYLLKVQRQQLEQKLKQAETWLLQLGKFARLVSYMICQNLVTILEDEITSFVANSLQAPRQKPFLSSQLVCGEGCQLSPMPSIESMTEILSEGLHSTKASALKLMQSADLKTLRGSLYFEGAPPAEDEEDNLDSELLTPKFQGQPSHAVRIFCGPNVGLLWPWKSHPITDILEVRGSRLRGQYLPPNYHQLQEDLDNNLGIQEALTTQQALLEGMTQEVQEFCREHRWITEVYEFLQAWGPQKLEDMRGCPVASYVTLVSQLSAWQAHVSNMPVQLLTKGSLLLLSCREVQAELESKLDSMKEDILTQVQNECWSRSQQLMTELTGFIQVFQTISTDIHSIALCSQKVNEANEEFIQLEERIEYIRSLHEFIRNYFNIFSAENEALDNSLLDMWEAFQFEKTQASEYLLSKQYAIVPKLQQLMAAALAELEGLLKKALSGPFMDPTQEQKSTESKLISMEHQFENTARHLGELHHAYVTFTGDESPVPLPVCGTRPIVLQQHIWHLYRTISETFSEWKCIAFVKFSLSVAQEKTDGWLTEAARMSTTLGVHSPVLQRCMRMLEEFRGYLPLLTKLGSSQRQNLNYQSLMRALGLSNLQSMELLTLGQLLTCPLLEFADRINQVWQCDNERTRAQESLQQLQQDWEVRQLRLLNFILYVPYESSASEHSKKQTVPSPQWKAVGKDSGTFILSDAEKSCQPVLETLRQAMDGTVYAHSTLELQTLQPTVNFLATTTVPGGCGHPLCPRLFRLFTVLALGSVTQATLLSRHTPSIQAWLERFPSVEQVGILGKALVQASVEAWEAVCRRFMPSPLHPHYRFSLHSVSHLLGSLQLLPSKVGSQVFEDCFYDKEHLYRVSGLQGTCLTIMMTMRCVVRLWLHEAQRTFCDRLDSPRERSDCANLLLEIAQRVFCHGPGRQPLGKDHKEEEEEEEETVPEVESEGELAQWENMSNSNSETEEEEDPYGLQATPSSYSTDPSLAPSIKTVSLEPMESISHKAEQEESRRASSCKLQSEESNIWWQKAGPMDMVTPLLLPVLLLRPKEKPSDLVFCQELILGSNSEGPNLYLERQWVRLEKQLATSAAQLRLSPHLVRIRPLAQHVARLVRVLSRPRQHGLLLSGALGTGRRTAITLATSICQAHLFHLPTGPEEAILRCLRDASWDAGMLSHPVALLVPKSVDLTTLYRLAALASVGNFPEQYTEADLDSIEEHLPRENLGIKYNTKKEIVLQRFYQQVCSHLHMFFLMGDDQAQKKLPSTFFLRLLQLATASIDHYESWDQASLVRVAQYHLEGAESLPLDDGSFKCPDLQASIPSVAKAMALIHLSAAYYHEHLCPVLPLVTPKTFLDFLDTFLLLQQKMILKMKNRAKMIQNALENLRILVEQHRVRTTLVINLEHQLKDSQKNLNQAQQQLEQSKLLYKQQLSECRHQENLTENLAKQRDALQAQHEAFLDQMGKAFLGPLSQLQVADFEEIRSYRAPPESVVRVTDALCELFHRETGWASAKQLLCTEDFYQELVFFPKEKMTDLELVRLNQALKAPGMSDAALRAVSVPAASLATWLWAVLRYRLAQHRGLPTGLLLRQVEATLAREQARLGHYQLQAQEKLEDILTWTKKVQDAHAAHRCMLGTLTLAQHGRYQKWTVRPALITPIHTWTMQLQVTAPPSHLPPGSFTPQQCSQFLHPALLTTLLACIPCLAVSRETLFLSALPAYILLLSPPRQNLKGHCLTVFGDALVCSAAIVYLGPFPPPRRQELLDKWLALCRGFQEALGPDDVAQALKQKQKSGIVVPPKTPLLPTRLPFRILSLLSCSSEQNRWDRDLKPQVKSARLAGLLLRSCTHYHSCRWPLLLDPSNQALMWLSPLPLEENSCLASAPMEGGGNGLMGNPNRENKEEPMGGGDDNGERNEAKEQAQAQKAKEQENEEEKEEHKGEEEKEEEEKEEEEKEHEAESQGSKPACETPSPPLLCLSVLSGTDPKLGPRLREAAASGQPVLLTNMELGLGCPELQWLLQREQLSPPHVQPGFCLYLSTTLPLHALEKVLGCELLKGLNVLDLGLNLEVLENQVLHEVMHRECPELEIRWEDLKTRALDACEAIEAAEEQLLTMLLFQNPLHEKPTKFMRDIVRAQAKICQMQAHYEELKEQKLQEVVLWVPYQQVVWHGIAIVKTLSTLQNSLPFFHMSAENWLAAIRQALDSMKPHDIQHREDLASHLLQLKAHLTRQLLGITLTALGLTQVPLVGALGALALLQVTENAPKLERLALWPGLAASPSTGYQKPDPGVVRPAWLTPRAWHECGILEVLPPFVGLRASLADRSKVWQDYLSLHSTVLGPAPGPSSEPLSLLQKLILWRVLRPESLAGALADLTTSLLGRPLDENLGIPTLPFEQSQATQPILILLPPPGHPTTTLHPLTVIQKQAASNKQGQNHLQVIALGSEAWNPVSDVVSTLNQAMLEGHWLVLDNCHLMSHWPRELLQPLLGLLDGAKVVSDQEQALLLAQAESRNAATVHRDFRLWLIASAEASASLPAVLSQHCMPVFWDQSLELGHILIHSLELAQQGSHMQSPTQALPLLLLHGLLLHRQLYAARLQAHRGRWSHLTLTQALETQEQLWASLSNPSTAMQELAASVFYGGSLGDTKDREALISLTQACLRPRSHSWVQPHTPQYLLATLMPSPDLGKLDAMAECKAQMHLLPTPSEPQTCGLSEGPQAWLLRRQSLTLLRVLQQSSTTWVPAARGGARRTERRLWQRLVQAKQKLESLQALLSNHTRRDPSSAVRGRGTRRPLEDFLEAEALELSQLVGTLQRDLDCQLRQLKGEPPCPSHRCAAVAHALWTGRLPAPWRPHAPSGPQPPWQWLRQLSSRGELLVSYLGANAGTEVSERVFHLSAFRHPRRLLLALRWEAALEQRLSNLKFPGSEGPSSCPVPHRHRELSGSPLHLRVENGPSPMVPETGLLLVGLQLLHAKWDPAAGALQDCASSQPSPLPPVSVSARAQRAGVLSRAAGPAVYSCPVYRAGPLGGTKLHSRNILMHIPLPTKLSLAACVQRRVHVCSPPLP
ncbi:PREDICTED: dynein heavy chain domain-containing protein 1 isoform X11 [Chinchilla lanigera]|uniref:dynein heavy chain domain-containing protein 1 isoform X11 n=1 Tax=Chinchilla lanigera TaxID=34839 RepID=UPI0006985C3B|nr:PREDICTED: dynein heavy chain domain-containing protein 1 isoform X11 [Chinchilla lanigera]